MALVGVAFGVLLTFTLQYYEFAPNLHKTALSYSTLVSDHSNQMNKTQHSVVAVSSTSDSPQLNGASAPRLPPISEIVFAKKFQRHPSLPTVVSSKPIKIYTGSPPSSTTTAPTTRASPSYSPTAAPSASTTPLYPPTAAPSIRHTSPQTMPYGWTMPELDHTKPAEKEGLPCSAAQFNAEMGNGLWTLRPHTLPRWGLRDQVCDTKPAPESQPVP